MEVEEPALQIERDGKRYIWIPERGEYLELRGYGALKGMFHVDPRIDLTKPIYEQVLLLEQKDKKAASTKRRKRTSSRNTSAAA